MAAPAPSTPLVALEGAVLDTETTGLDARTARLVQIGAIRVTGERLDLAAVHESLVDPEEPIPPGSTAIHGILDADVLDAPKASAAVAALDAFLGERVVIGHSIWFDLQIIAREAARTGAPWAERAALDIRLLGRAALPSIASHDLDALCAALGVQVHGRHTAMGDARATAEAFSALIPLLRERGIRTLAEAQAASRRAREIEATAAPGAPPPPELPEAVPGWAPPARLDGYLYRHRISDLMSAPAVTLPADATIAEATRLMIERSVSSVVVENAEGGPGIFTERDALRALDGAGSAGLDAPLAELQRRPLKTIEADAFVYRAIGRSARLGIRHLGVTDAEGRVVGMVTTRNLLKHRSTAAMILGDQICVGADEAELGQAWATLAELARGLIADQTDPRAIAAVISAEICQLTGRAAELGEARMLADGRGPPPCAYAVMVLGSAGRGESLLAADQDNAIVFAEGVPGGTEDLWFADLGGHIADMLDRVGVPYCKGGVMARHEAWRRSAQGWTALVDDWVARQNPQDLLNVDIFFDAVAVHGDRRLADAVLEHAFARAALIPTFWRALAEQLPARTQPFRLFGGLRTGEDGRIDLKMAGLFPIVAAARVMAIKTGRRLRATPERLGAAVDTGAADPDQVARIAEAHQTILGAMLTQQVADSAEGRPLGPKVDPKLLGKAGVAALTDALGEVSTAIDLVREGVY